MEIKDVIRELESLILLDSSAVHSFDQALTRIAEHGIIVQLRLFREDHERHIVELTSFLQTLGGTPPNPHVQEALLQRFASLNDITGACETLEVLYANEKIMNRRYAEALTLDLPADIKELIESNYSDEQQHLAYIESVLHPFAAAT